MAGSRLYVAISSTFTEAGFGRRLETGKNEILPNNLLYVHMIIWVTSLGVAGSPLNIIDELGDLPLESVVWRGV